jgi:hypothetical protein
MAEEKPKIGAGHAAAMGRLGLKELRNALNPSREGAADSEIGLYGTMTQGEIAMARGSYGTDPEQEKRQEQNGQEQAAPASGQARSNVPDHGQPSPAVAQELAAMRGRESHSRGR